MDHQYIDKFTEVYAQFQREITIEWSKRFEHLLSSSQATILYRLKIAGPQRITDLARELKITPGAVTGLSQKLIASNYATRDRDTKDRRVVYLTITEEGLTILHQYRKQSKEAVQAFFKGIPLEDIDQLMDTYKKVIQNIQNMKS